MMKMTFTQKMTALLFTMLSVLMPQTVHAQDEVDIEGYVNVWIDVQAVPEGGGKVFAAPQDQANKVWRDKMSLKQPIPVGSMMGTEFTMFMLYAQPATADGYIFGGWYKDDGDGTFNIETDQLISEEETYTYMDALDDDAKVYDTSAKAKNGDKPTEADMLIFAYFTRGARVSMSYYQDGDEPLHANCGSVWISKSVNEPGDQVTVRAIANDGFQFEYWQDKDEFGNIVSRQNPYTFTVQGGEHLYAYFTATDAPSFDLPEEGGFLTANIWDCWVMAEDSYQNGGRVLLVEAEDLVRTDDGKAYLDMDKPEVAYQTTQWRGVPSIIYGKGKVRFAYKMAYSFARIKSGEQLVRWSGDGGTELKGDVIYVYVFIDELGAFVQYGTTDDFNPDYTPTVKVPAGVAYFSMSAYDLTDDQGNIPTVIGLSPETYDRGVAGRDGALEQLSAIEGAQLSTTTLKGQKVYTLTGVEVKTTAEKGVFIVNGKKMVLK